VLAARPQWCATTLRPWVQAPIARGQTLATARNNHKSVSVNSGYKSVILSDLNKKYTKATQIQQFAKKQHE
jgi:hypothetical protein